MDRFCCGLESTEVNPVCQLSSVDCVHLILMSQIPLCQIPVWLRTEEPVELTGLDEYPKVGDRYELFGELWRVEEVSGRVVLTREPS